MEAPVSGDNAALATAKAQGSLEKTKERLQRIGVFQIPELESINTIDQLSIEPFKFNFLLQVKDNPEGLSLPTPHEFNTLARVVEKKPLTLEIKTNGGLLFKMKFPKEEELVTQLPGTKDKIVGKSNKVMALVSEDNRGKKGKFYTVEFDHAKEVIESAGEDGNQEGEGGGKEGGEGTKGDKNQNFSESSKGQLFNDLAGFFKFTYNNRPTNESHFLDKIAPLLKEEEGDNPINVENTNGKIYVKDITLGPKAKVRAGEERGEYGKKAGLTQNQKWDGNPKNLTDQFIGVKNVYLEITDTSADPNAVNAVKHELNGEQYKKPAKIRKSLNFKQNNTIIIGLENNKAVVCKIPSTVTDLRGLIDVELSKKPMRNDNFDKPVKAKLQITL